MIAVSFVYHGIWNLSPRGETWWTQEAHFPFIFRIPVGLIELALAALLWSPKLTRAAGLVICALMAGAIFEHFPQGYSFKTNGVETPLAYFLVGLHFMLPKKSV